MDEKMDRQTQTALLNALEAAKAHGQKWEDAREQRLWKKVNIPCPLSDAINGLSKNEMDRIRKNLNLANLSSLRKEELATELAKLIPVKFKQVIYTLDQGRYDLVRMIVNHSGVIPDPGIAVAHAESFLGDSIIFPGVHNSQKVLYMPIELVKIFSQIDGIDLQRIVRRNTEWINLTQGMLYYYGVVDAWLVKEKVEQLTGAEVDFLEFMNVIASAADFHGQVRRSANGYSDHRVFEPQKVVAEHKMRASVDYYPFSKQQLLKAGAGDYIDRTSAMNRFISFLLEYYRLTTKDTDELRIQLVNLINMDANSTAIISYLQSWFEFPSFDFVQQLTAKIMELHNNTRQWVLKGHTPHELFCEEKQYLKPLPPEPFIMGQTASNVADIRKRTKVGRNAPCPCGSGKKYKKCCGK
jgi:hypothetical protein